MATLALGSIFSSCEDFLSVESPDQLTSDKYWRNESDALSGLACAYAQLEYSTSSWEMSEVIFPVHHFREDILTVGADIYNWTYMLEYYDFTYNAESSQAYSWWANNYQGANYANQVITKVSEMGDEKIDPTIREQIVNEAYFLRGYYHLRLLLDWKEIIISDSYVDASNLYKPLSTREAAWDFIINDFKKAAALPATLPSSNIGRATSGAANAYLGLAYLTRAYEEPANKEGYLREALAAFNEVKGYELEKDFLSMFDGSNKNCKESIFELQFSMNSDGGAYYRHQIHKFVAPVEVSGWEEMYPSQQLLNEFMKEGKTSTKGGYDSRYYQTVVADNEFWNEGNSNEGTGKLGGYNYFECFSEWDDNGPIEGTTIDKKFFAKYLPKNSDLFWGNYSDVQIPLMRYANVLLMKAEVLNLQGHPEQAIPLINQVRSVHGDMPAMTGTSQADVQAQIEHERMIEFPLEAWRFYDLRRWGKLDQAIHATGRTNFSSEKNAFYPVPQGEINVNTALSDSKNAE